MLAESVRSGLVESRHDGAVAVCDPDGSLIASYGEIDRPFFIRSSCKPFQAYVSQGAGAGLTSLQLALACSSHRGHPSQVAIVEDMLGSFGLSETQLGCPPDWPANRGAAIRLARAGAKEARRLWYNCSGKHAAFLRACVASGWPTGTYLSPAHPLQTEVTALVEEIGGFDPKPVGVDGCGAPVHRTTARAMARMYARLASDQRFDEVFTSMHRYPAMVGGNGEPDSSIATALDAVAKGGAQGCIGVGLKSGGLGIAVKSWDGSGQVATVAAVAALEQLGRLPGPAAERLAEVSAPIVRGGGEAVGRLENRLRIEAATGWF